MEELEREVELAMNNLMEQPQQPIPQLPEHMPAAKKGDEKNLTSSQTGEGCSGNLAQALRGGGGMITPSQLATQELEDEVEKELKLLLTDQQFEAKMEECRNHPEFNSYCEGIRYELGFESDVEGAAAWEWGEQEPYLDVLGFLVWVKAKTNMLHALGVGPAVTPAPVKAPPGPTAEVAKVEAPKVATPPALPPAPVETPKVVQTPALPPAPVETPRVVQQPALPPAPVGTPALPPAQLTAPAPVPSPPQAVGSGVPAPSDLSGHVEQVVSEVKKDTKPNSTTHRKEYMAFLRAANNPILFLFSLLKKMFC